MLTPIPATSSVSAVTRGQSVGKLIAATRAMRDRGDAVGFWWSSLRDTICRLTYLVPFVGLLGSLRPPGAKRESLRDLQINNACNGVKLTEIDRQRLYRLRHEPTESEAEREEVTAA